MKTRKANLMLAFLVTLLALPFAAQAQRGGAPRDADAILHNPRALARYLRLTPDQVAAAQRLQTELRADLEPLRANEKQLREALRAEVSATNPNACEVGQAFLAVRANEEAIQGAIQEYDRQFSALLTPEQLARYEALKEATRLLGGGDS
jgi:Spy/CpxP family protein refolding chaperone